MVLLHGATVGCWANDYPDGCDEEDCTSYLFGYAIAAIPLFLVLVSLIVNNLAIFFYVRRNFKAKNQISESSRGGQGSLEEMQREIRQATQLREVATQGFFYVGSFFLTYTAGFLLRIRESMSYTREDEEDLFLLMAFSYLLIPWQGFFNMIIYNRPNYNRIRVAYPEKGRLWAFQYVCFNSEIPKLSSLTLSSTGRIKTSNPNSTGTGTITGTGKRAARFSSDLAPVMEEEEGDYDRSNSLHFEDPGGPSLALPQSSRNLVGTMEDDVSSLDGQPPSFRRIDMIGSVQREGNR